MKVASVPHGVGPLSFSAISIEPAPLSLFEQGGSFVSLLQESAGPTPGGATGSDQASRDERGSPARDADFPLGSPASSGGGLETAGAYPVRCSSYGRMI